VNAIGAGTQRRKYIEQRAALIRFQPACVTGRRAEDAI
jgi:hypothetical protein